MFAKRNILRKLVEILTIFLFRYNQVRNVNFKFMYLEIITQNWMNEYRLHGKWEHATLLKQFAHIYISASVLSFPFIPHTPCYWQLEWYRLSLSTIDWLGGPSLFHTWWMTYLFLARTYADSFVGFAYRSWKCTCFYILR